MSLSEPDDSLRKFLQDYTRDSTSDVKAAIRYFDASVDLNGDGNNETIVYLADSASFFCGSGGCQTLVLASENSSYRLVARVLITNPPIRVLYSSSHGWRNIAVWVQGGGIQPGYEAELPFDGTKYPIGAMAPPAHPLAGNASGEVVIPAFQSILEGKVLFPTQ